MDTKMVDFYLQWVRTGQQFDGTDPITDTSKLAVGQDVWISCVDQGFIEGKVVKVTPEGADVQATGQGIIHFNSKGYLPFGAIHDPMYWRIDSLPFAERRAMLERGRQKTMAVGQKVWMQSGVQFLEGTVEEVTEYYVRVAIPPTPYAYAIDFRYNGSQWGVWGGMDGWDPRPLGGPSGPWRLTEMMDTKTLVTGPNIWMKRVKQKIWMKSVNEKSGETQFLETAVTAITEKCVEVELPGTIEGKGWRV